MQQDLVIFLGDRLLVRIDSALGGHGCSLVPSQRKEGEPEPCRVIGIWGGDCSVEVCPNGAE